MADLLQAALDWAEHSTDPQFKALAAEVVRLKAEQKMLAEPRLISEWHEDFGSVLWWTMPVDEPPWVGTPLDSDWPGYHMFWTPLPPAPADVGLPEQEVAHG